MDLSVELAAYIAAPSFLLWNLKLMCYSPLTIILDALLSISSSYYTDSLDFSVPSTLI